MGNAASEQKYDFFKDVVSHGKEEDGRFGLVGFYHERSEPGKLYVSKKIWTDSSQESLALAELLQRRQAVTHPHLARLVSYEKALQHHTMTSFTRHLFVWEYFDNNLERDIRTRQAGEYGSGVLYGEPQLWYLLNAAINADLALQRAGELYHGNVQPATLLLDAHGHAKLLDNRTLFPTLSTYDRMLHSRAVRAAVSPNLMRCLAQGLVAPSYNRSKESSWALGLTGLCAAAGRNLDDYYDWRRRRVLLETIEADLQGLEGFYSAQLVGFLRNCLQEDEPQRLPLEAHEEFLASFQAAIYAMQLDFARRTQRVFYDDVVETKVIYETDEQRTEVQNDLLTGASDFFGGGDPPPAPQVIPAQGDFFATSEIVELPLVQNAYVLSSHQSRTYF